MPNINPEEKKVTFDVSYATFIRLIVVLVVLFLVYLLREIILILFLAIIIAAAISPMVVWLQKKKIPKGVGIILIYVAVAGLVALAIGALVPPIAHQIAQLQRHLPQYFETLYRFFERIQAPAREEILSGLRGWLEMIGGQLARAAGGLYQAVANVFAAIFTTIIILILSFYFTLQEGALEKIVRSLTPTRSQAYLIGLVTRVQQKMGDWLRGQVTLCVIVGVVCFLGLWILRVEYSLALGAFAGITEIIPYIGPIIGAIPAVILAFTQSPWLGLAVVVFYVVVQQLENHFLVPTIMGKAVGLNPIVIILVVLIGARLAGVLGAIIAVPIATAANIFLKDLLERGKFTFPGEKPDGIA